MGRSSARGHSAEICQSAQLPACCATKGSVAASRRGTGGRGECRCGRDQAKPDGEDNGRWRTPSVVSGLSQGSIAVFDFSPQFLQANSNNGLRLNSMAFLNVPLVFSVPSDS